MSTLDPKGRFLTMPERYRAWNEIVDKAEFDEGLEVAWAEFTKNGLSPDLDTAAQLAGARSLIHIMLNLGQPSAARPRTRHKNLVADPGEGPPIKL